MALIEWLRYPTSVNQSVRIIPVQVQLPTGALPADLQVVSSPTKTSPNVSLYLENAAVVSKTLSVPLNQFEVYLSVSTIDDHDVFVSGLINPEAKQSIVVTLSDSVSGVESYPIYIDITPIPAQTITSEKTLFSDDFSGTSLSRDNWTAARTVAAVSAAPNQTVASSLLSLNNAAVALGYTDITSDVIEGRAHIEWRGVIESVHRAECSFILGAYFLDLDATAVASFTDASSQGYLAFGFNWNDSGYVSDPATTVRIMHGQNNSLVGPNTAVVLAAGGVVTTAHTYTIDFDGHTAIYSIDGTVVATVTTRIPPVGAKRFIVIMASRTTGVPAGTNKLDIDRVDVASDERIVTSGTISGGGGGGGGVVVNVELQGSTQSKQAPDPAAIAGTAADLLLYAEPDGALRTRTRATTDETSFAGNFPGAAVWRALTGTSLFTAGLTTVVGTGTLYTSEVRVGDYVEMTADHSLTAPIWAQVQSILDDTHLTLRTAYAGAGAAAAGASRVSDWIVGCTAGAGDAVAVGAGVCTLTLGAANASRAYLARRLGAGGRKGFAPLWSRFFIKLDVRRANNGIFMGFLSSLGAAAAFTGVVGWSTKSGEPATMMSAITGRDASAGLVSAYDSLPIPNDGTTADSDPHLYEVGFYEDQAVFLIDAQRVGSFQYTKDDGGIPYPYTEMYLVLQIENTAATAGATVFTIADAHCKSLDVLDTRPVQPDPDKLRTSTFDKTPFSGNAPRAATTINDNAVHEITDSTGTGMDMGKHYVVNQIGGVDIQVYIAAVAPAVATARRSPFHLYSGVPWEFSPHAVGLRLWAVKAVDGTANADVYCDSTDGGGGA